MRHRCRGRKLNRTSSHRRAMFANLVCALVKHEQLRTTLPKAKSLRPIAERLITLARKQGLHHRRQVLAFLGDGVVVRKLFSGLAERYKQRPGGYTRIIKDGWRHGDAASVAIIELVDRDLAAKGQASGPVRARPSDSEQS